MGSASGLKSFGLERVWDGRGEEDICNRLEKSSGSGWETTSCGCDGCGGCGGLRGETGEGGERAPTGTGRSALSLVRGGLGECEMDCATKGGGDGTYAWFLRWRAMSFSARSVGCAGSRSRCLRDGRAGDGCIGVGREKEDGKRGSEGEDEETACAAHLPQQAFPFLSRPRDPVPDAYRSLGSRILGIASEQPAWPSSVSFPSR